ncbi:MAG: hypothetical protein HQK83_18985 [Fibrobacteria bacterium]|nr:hypothetical protein [Fibrobacteria bacterium]
MREFVGIFLVFFVVSAMYNCKENRSYAVGVGQSQVSAKIDLTDKLNPQILPDVLKGVLASIQINEKPDSKKFQQKVVQRFSTAIMNDAGINYAVDLNEDGVVDPLMIKPESVDKEGVVYSLRVPDPTNHPKDPGSGADWDNIADNESIELVEVAVSFSEVDKELAISANPNHHVYENSRENTHYTSHYSGHHHSWMETYFQYRLFSMVLFGPYGWGFGPFYGGYYGGYYRPYGSAARMSRGAHSSRYAKSARTNTGLKTGSGKALRGSKSASRTSMPKSIKQMKSRRAMAVRKQKYNGRRGGFGSGKNTGIARRSGSGTRTGGFGRSRARSFGGGGSRGWGK